MLEYGRILFWAFAVALVAYVLATLENLPPIVASHFDAAGVPNGWSSRPSYALLLLAIGVLLPLAVVALIRTLTRNGPSGLNIPAHDHWTRPEHRGEAVRRVREYVWWLACVMSGTALLIHFLVLAAHTRQPPRLSTVTFLIVLGGILLGILGWTAGWYSLLRRPPDRSKAAEKRRPLQR